MSFDCESPKIHDALEIRLRFRRIIEQRIERLERDAASDEAFLTSLDEPDHIRRQMRLVAVQRAEAKRMRQFLEGARTRDNEPMNTL
jgi:hypothetical protein